MKVVEAYFAAKSTFQKKGCIVYARYFQDQMAPGRGSTSSCKEIWGYRNFAWSTQGPQWLDKSGKDSTKSLNPTTRAGRSIKELNPPAFSVHENFVYHCKMNYQDHNMCPNKSQVLFVAQWCTMLFLTKKTGVLTSLVEQPVLVGFWSFRCPCKFHSTIHLFTIAFSAFVWHSLVWKVLLVLSLRVKCFVAKYSIPLQPLCALRW